MSVEAKIELDEDEYVEKFKPFMMDLVHEWCKGASFKHLMTMTDMFEVCIFTCQLIDNCKDPSIIFL